MDDASNRAWPAWFYGPKGESGVYEKREDVPAGWEDHPSKVINASTTGSAPLVPAADRVPAEQRGSAPVTAENDAPAGATGGAPAGDAATDVSNTIDAHGWPWDRNLHAATKSMTTAGLWRMKVGVSRPDPKPGFPKPAQPLDL